jgi:serine/threonine-protein kinase
MVSGYGRVYVIDWGLAKLRAAAGGADREAETGEHTPLGTQAYMAPEQAAGGPGAATDRADVFGLGGVLCALLTSRPPYTGTWAEVYQQARAADTSDARRRLAAADSPRRLADLVGRCLARCPADRPATALAVVEEVHRYRVSAVG